MPDTEQTRPLSGCRVWVTRPAHQALAILTSLHALGADILALPLLEIKPYVDEGTQAHLAAAVRYDLVIFISANAVEFSAPWHKKIANVLDLAVIGKATAAKCAEYGLNCRFVPDKADSEGLLAMPRLQTVKGQRILIVRGHAGRELLATALQARGAQVDYAEVYARYIPALTLGPEQADVDVIMLTSSEMLSNLATLARRDQQAWVFNKQLLLIHERMAGRARELGFTLKPLVASEASDSGMIDALLEWERSERRMMQ